MFSGPLFFSRSVVNQSVINYSLTVLKP